MTSKVDICNRALSSIGSKSVIQDIDEGSTESVQCKLHYTPARRTALASMDWRFASRQVTLALTANTPTLWAYEYAWPNYCIEPREILPSVRSGKPIPFDVVLNDTLSARVIHTDEAEAVLRYTADAENANVYPPQFEDVLVASLATRLVIPLTRDQKLLPEARAQYMMAIGLAQAGDLELGVPDESEDSDYIAGRA